MTSYSESTSEKIDHLEKWSKAKNIIAIKSLTLESLVFDYLMHTILHIHSYNSPLKKKRIYVFKYDSRYPSITWILKTFPDKTVIEINCAQNMTNLVSVEHFGIPPSSYRSLRKLVFFH